MGMRKLLLSPSRYKNDDNHLGADFVNFGTFYAISFVFRAPRPREPHRGSNFGPPGLGNWFPEGGRSFGKPCGFRFLGPESAHGAPRRLPGSEEGALEADVYPSEDFEGAQCLYCRACKVPIAQKKVQM